MMSFANESKFKYGFCLTEAKIEKIKADYIASNFPP